MKKNLIFRVLGVLGSALIIASVFLPFISVTGYSSSIWETYKLTDSLYLPIMLMAFGVIGVIFFSLDKKTEFAYMSTGAVLFFLVIQTTEVINQDLFNTLSIGYYGLVIGAILTGLMAFLTNLKSKKENNYVQNTSTEQPSMLDQMDNLYGAQSTPQITPVQPLENIQVEPIPINPKIEPVPVVPNMQVVEPTPVQPVSPVLPDLNNVKEVTNIGQNLNQSTPVMNQEPIKSELPSFNNTQPQIQNGGQVINPTMYQFNNLNSPTQQPMNPALRDFNNVNEETINPTVKENPVLKEFNNSLQGNSGVEPKVNPTINTSNPVLAEFNNQPKEQTNAFLTGFNNTQPQTTNVESHVSGFTNPNMVNKPNEGATDIFGQPINR